MNGYFVNVGVDHSDDTELSDHHDLDKYINDSVLRFQNHPSICKIKDSNISVHKFNFSEITVLQTQC